MDYNDWFEYRTNVDYVMTEKGTLVDPNKPTETPSTSAPKTKNDDYRYEDATAINKETAWKSNVQRTGRTALKLEDKEGRIQKKRNYGSTLAVTAKKKAWYDDDNEDVAGSPIFSLVQIFN